MNPKVDLFLNKAEQWQAEMTALRGIVLDCNLNEELKWGVPCYTFQKTNLLLIGHFKAYCTLSFIKGVLLKDPEQILVAPGENSQSARILRFTSLKEIHDLESVIKAYVFESIEAEKAGIQIEKKQEAPLVEELQNKLQTDETFKRAFDALTPGRKRAYNIYFSGAKQSKTRVSRIEQYTDRILKGYGFNDCVCGLSKRMPNCDGSHKNA